MRKYLVVAILVCSGWLAIAQQPSAPTLGSGKGTLTVQPAQPGTNHGIGLTWTAPSNCSGCTYNAYRGTSTGAENYTSPVNTSPITTTTFLDQTGTAGTTYYYTVTAKNGTIEGVPSNEASASYPTVPGSPSGLAATPQ